MYNPYSKFVRMTRTQKFFFLTIITITVLIIISITSYVVNFHTHTLSSKPADWGALGDYIGGVINPILSLASLVVLGYITMLLSKEGTEENKKLFLLQQKMAAYQDLTKHAVGLNSFVREYKHVLEEFRFIKDNHTGDVMFQIMPETYHKIHLVLKPLSDYYYTLFTFKVKYGHLFKYDFKNSNFLKLLELSKKQVDDIDFVSKSFLNKRDDVQFSFLKSFNEFTVLSVEFINSIREELEN